MPCGDAGRGLESLIESDALGQLIRRTGRVAELCTEGQAMRMDWVDGVASLLADDRPLAELEELGAAWYRRGIRHVIWSGMGGSGVIVGVLRTLGLIGNDGDGITIHPLDSTDPTAVDRIAADLARRKGLEDRVASLSRRDLRALLADVAMIAVSFGINSEEPVTHLSWFLELLDAAGLRPDRNAHVLTVDGSRLEGASRRYGLPSSAVCFEGCGNLPGRMSAPGTQVFLLPFALARGGSAQARHERTLHQILSEAWAAHDLEAAVAHPRRAPYVRLAASLFDHSQDGRCRLLLDLAPSWRPLHIWIEQLLEQTLGKDGKGVVVLHPQRLNARGLGYSDDPLVRATHDGRDGPELPTLDRCVDRRASLATALLGWELAAAMVGYLNGTNIVDEPAVEDYKSRARALSGDHPSLVSAIGRAAATTHSIEPVADAILTRARERSLSYLDVTVNGELPDSARRRCRLLVRRLGNEHLGVPVKLRFAPAAYHVSEQCQLDGPDGVLSIRVAARETPPSTLGHYTGEFLQAQAVGAAEAMNAVGRDCTLFVVDRLLDTPGLLERITAAIGARIPSKATT
jgi:hypothetical protein